MSTLLTRLSLAQRSLIALLAVVAAVFGVVGTTSLKQELLPTLEFPQAFVTTQYQGASPSAVESEVTEPLEETIRGVEAVQGMQSESTTGNSQIIVETQYGENSDDVVRELQRAVADAQPQLPEDLQPIVSTGSIDDAPVIAVAATSDLSPEELTQNLEAIVVPELEDVEGVRAATVSGAPETQISIRVREDDLEDEGVDIASIASLLQTNGVPTAAGQLEQDGAQLPVEVGEQITQVDQLRDLRVTGTDGPVRLEDVADIETENVEESSISRTNGEPSLSISVTKRPDANTVDVSNQVKKALEGTTAEIGNGTEFTTSFDQAPFIEQSIKDLAVEGALGLVFAVLVILLFLLSARATIITALSIPLSLLIAIIALWAGDYSLNILTLGALTVAVGRVVDDSIVVIEAIRRHHGMGVEKRRAIIDAVREVAGAVTASTLTTVAVFLPLAFVSGITGEMFRPFALTVSVALVSSLLVSLTIVPVLAYWFLQTRGSKVRLSRAAKKQITADRKAGLKELRAERKAAKRASRRGERTAPSTAPHAVASDATAVDEAESPATQMDPLEGARTKPTRLQRTYLPVLRFTLGHPIVALALAVLVFIGTMMMTPLLKTDFLGGASGNTMQVTQTLPDGSSLEDTDEAATQVEDILGANGDVESYEVTIGGSGIPGMGGDTNSAMFTVTVNPDADLTSVTNDLREETDGLGDDAGEIEVGAAAATGTSNEIEVIVQATDDGTLREGTDALTEDLREVDGVSEVSNNLEAAKSMLEVRIDQERAAEEGYSEAQIGEAVSRVVRGQNIGEIIVDDTSQTVYLYEGETRESVDALRDLELPITQAQTAEAQEDAAADAAAAAAAAPGAGSDPGAGSGSGSAPGAGSGAGAGAAAPAPSVDPSDIDRVTLDDIANVDEVETAPTITRTDGLRASTVTVTPEGDNLGAATATVEQAIADADLPDGISTSIRGASQDQDESFAQMGIAMLVAVVLVFIIMVATFRSLVQPFILLVSIPFAATGSIGLLLLSNTALGLPAMIGLLMLIGIVVTNAIVLIDLINHYRRYGLPLRQAVIDGARLRYRPILMTAAATICALVPMSLGLTGGGVFISQSLAIVVIGGMVSSTVLTLLIVPVLYYLVEGAKERRAQKKAVKERARERVLSREEAAAEGREPVGAGVGAGHSAASAGAVGAAGAGAAGAGAIAAGDRSRGAHADDGRGAEPTAGSRGGGTGVFDQGTDGPAEAPGPDSAPSEPGGVRTGVFADESPTSEPSTPGAGSVDGARDTAAEGNVTGVGNASAGTTAAGDGVGGNAFGGSPAAGDATGDNAFGGSPAAGDAAGDNAFGGSTTAGDRGAHRFGADGLLGTGHAGADATGDPLTGGSRPGESQFGDSQPGEERPGEPQPGESQPAAGGDAQTGAWDADPNRDDPVARRLRNRRDDEGPLH